MRDRLFSNVSLREFLNGQIRKIPQAVSNIPDDEVRSDPAAAIAEITQLLDVQPISIDWETKRADPLTETSILRRGSGQSFVPSNTTPVKVPANKVTWRVAYRGTTQVLTYRASRHRSGEYTALAFHPDIVYSVELPQASSSAAAFTQEAQRIEKWITESVEWANTDIAAWRPGFIVAVEQAVAARAQHLQSQEDLATALNIPLKRSAEPQTVPIPVTRRKIVPVEQKATARATPEPAITQAIYEDIIRTIRSVGNSFERLPRTAAKFYEEELRDLLLFILNSNFEGAVAGEMFNGSGKTDVLLRWMDRNAFIGECKIWKGSKAFTEAIDQLLGYTVWRDTKAALILFIKDGDATSIIGKADSAIREHSCFVRAVDSPEPDERMNYVMHAMDDDAREIQLAFLPIVIRPLQ